MIRELFWRLLETSPRWAVVIAIALGITAFELIRRGIVAGTVSWLVLLGVVVLPIFGGYVWKNDSSTLGRTAGLALVLLVGGSAGLVVLVAAKVI